MSDKPVPPAGSPLGALLAHIERQRARRGPVDQDAAARYFRRAWSRLEAEQRLVQALAAVPDNAGPLNSRQLVHRMLTLLHTLSPGYLQHFIAHVDALQWLERQQPSRPPAR